MGRKKIPIKPITDERNRHVTFNKRKSGLIKKAMELSILCNCQISLVIFNAENQLFEYCSTDPRFILQRYCQVAHLPHERLANADYSRFDKATRNSKGKGKKNGQDLNNGNSNDNDSNDCYSMSGSGMMERDQAQMNFQTQNFGQLQGTGFDSSLAQQNMQADQQLSSRFTQAGSAQQRSTLNAFANENLTFTPLTPNFTEDMHDLIRQNAIGGNEQIKSEGINYEPSQLDMQNQQQQQQHVNMMTMQYGNNNNKRKQLPSYDELGQEQQEEDSPQFKKRKFNNLTIQVPANRTQIPMRRVEGDIVITDLSQVTSEQLQRYQLMQQHQQQQQQMMDTAQFQVPKDKPHMDETTHQVIPPTLNSSGNSSDTQGLTPLGASFALYTTDKSPSSPSNLSTPTTLTNMDWTTKSKEVIPAANTAT
jgi:SepF-like predicted cell division protein (DUF552 family)